ncbi:DUF2924 domain-containing protein [Sphingomonas sp. YL-JM2C]
MTKIEKQLAALTTMSSAQLRDEWLRNHDGEAPSVPDHLLKQLIAHRAQERRHGGLPATVRRELQRETDDPSPSKPVIKIELGARLVREWNGQTIIVEALEKGFQWDDRHYTSLSAIAREVTGAHWSGPRFFGLNSHG